jgi:hypothetical protein
VKISVLREENLFREKRFRMNQAFRITGKDRYSDMVVLAWAYSSLEDMAFLASLDSLPWEPHYTLGALAPFAKELLLLTFLEPFLGISFLEVTGVPFLAVTEVPFLNVEALKELEVIDLHSLNYLMPLNELAAWDLHLRLGLCLHENEHECVPLG